MRHLTITSILLIACFALDAHCAGWTMHTIDASSQGADGARMGDFNGDGLIDIVTPWEEGGAIRIAFNPGVAAVKEPWPSIEIGRVGSPEDAMAMDMNGDGRLDVVSSCEGKEQSIFVHLSPKKAAEVMNPEAWTTKVLPASKDRMQYMFSVPMDVNQDGRMDLISGGKNADAILGWFQAPEKRKDLDAWEWHPIMPLGWLMSLRVVTEEDPKDSTLLLSDRRGTYRGVYRLETPVKGTRLHKLMSKNEKSNPWAIKYIGGNKQEVMFMDYSRQGEKDWTFAWAVSGEGIRVQHTDFHEATAISLPMPANSGTGKAVALGDIDQDGNEDVVVTCENAAEKMGVFYYAQTRAASGADPGSWTLHDISGLTGTKFDRIELVDVDQDGDLDVITCEERENLGVIWYENPTK